MAEVIPFRGIMYNLDKVGDMAAVTTPPYDVIPPARQEAFYQRHPNNIIRLILGKVRPEDDDRDNRYIRAASDYRAWRRDGVLTPDAVPACYLNATHFTVGPDEFVRFGLIAAVRLEPFEAGIILPHERTFSKVKQDRLQLMKQCHANFSPIFAMYPDSEHLVDTLAAAVAETPPLHDFIDSDGHRQRFWRLGDAALHERIRSTFASRPIFIADGHHRYETALVYRDKVAAQTPGFSTDHPANFILMYLSSMEDPGMVILPAHRLLRQVDANRLGAFAETAARYFDITPYPANENGRREFIAALKQPSPEPVVGAVIQGRGDLLKMTLKPGVMADLFAAELHEALRQLDVTVLTRLIFMELLGFDQARLDNEQLIAYTTDAAEAIQRVDTDGFDAGFLLNSTPMDHIQAVASQRLIMPRKSTYFYPKVITGLVLNSLDR